MGKQYNAAINSNGELVNTVYDTETGILTVLKTEETARSKIMKTTAFTEEQKALLLELFK